MLVLLPASASLASSAPSAARDLRDLDSCESALALRVPPPQPEAASSSIPAVAIAVTESLVADTAESLCPVGRLENAKNRQPQEASRRAAAGAASPDACRRGSPALSEATVLDAAMTQP